jgi:hypothetical protein
MNAILKPIASPVTLDDLVVQLIAAKKIEDEAKAHRILVEDKIVAMTETREEGAVTVKTESGFSCTVTGSMTYKVDDIAVLIALTSDWKDNMRPIKTEVKLDTTGCKYLRAKEPALWGKIAGFIEMKPAKFAVKVSV